jgi:hypothetical protein
MKDYECRAFSPTKSLALPSHMVTYDSRDGEEPFGDSFVKDQVPSVDVCPIELDMQRSTSTTMSSSNNPYLETQKKEHASDLGITFLAMTDQYCQRKSKSTGVTQSATSDSSRRAICSKASLFFR